MSRELSTYEAMGGTYTERWMECFIRILWFLEEADVDWKIWSVTWIDYYMKSNHAEGVQHHIHCYGNLECQSF